ncbi:MAG TPA: hypothetical protein VHW71_11720 [Steroidobacteraceae bacterium]|nr:hypothetical protein [Steroidobacteraceae bacterium]
MSRFDEVGENKCESNRRSSRAERTDRYLAESDISIDAHVRHSQLALAQAMLGRVKIYLDTNYWVNLRKADTASSPNRLASCWRCCDSWLRPVARSAP